MRDIKIHILQLLNRLDRKSLISVKRDIERNYAVDVSDKEVTMRDDIKDKLFEIINLQFNAPVVELFERHEWTDLNMDAVDIEALAVLVEEEFETSYVTPDAMVRWNALKDVIDYIETELEEKQPPTTDMW